MTYNSRRAQELSKWAESLNKGDRFHDAMFKAYFVDGLNIAKIPILTEIVESIGLPGKEAQQVLAQETYKKAVDRDWAYSRACNVTAVPTFMVNDQRAVGAQPYETLRQLVSTTGAGLSMA